jgi:hypothetical protein
MAGSPSLEKAAHGRDIGAVTNPLHNKHLVIVTWVGLGLAAGCGHKPPAPATPAPQVVAPLPVTGLAGQQVILLPLTLVAAEDSLHWETVLADRHTVLARADSVVGTLLKARAPEITWVLPDDVRRAARRAPGVATDPDQLGTGILRFQRLPVVPDPLRSQLRTLAALSGSGGAEFVMVPAALVFKRAATGTGHAELVMVLANVRTGRIEWRTTAVGEGSDPWTTLARAVKSLTPGLP